MAEHAGEQEPVIESVMEKITDKLHGDDSSSSDSDDDKKADKSSSMEAVKSKVYRIFGREKPLHKVLGGGKPIWLSLATYFELPVSSQQSTQGALLGTMLVTEGFQFIPLWNKSENYNFNGGGILWIFLEWTVAPLIACACAFSLFALLRTYLLRHENAKKRILILLPIYYGVAVGLLCLFVMYQVIPNLVTVSEWITIVATAVSTLIGALLSVIMVVPLARKRFSTARNLKNTKRKSAMKEQCLESQDQTCQVKNEEDEDEKFEEALNDFMKMRVLDTVYEVDERSWGSPETIVEAENVQSVSVCTTGQSTPFKELLQSTPNRLVQMRNFQKIEKSTARDKAAKFIQDSTKSSFFPVKIPLFFTVKFGGILIFTWKCHCTLSTCMTDSDGGSIVRTNMIYVQK